MKKTIISSSDYELYKIPLPWSFLLKRKGKMLILSELEKMHPRFSGNCCFDTRFFLEKKQLVADVVVMEKARVAEYKNSGGLLYIDNGAKRNVFAERTLVFRLLTIFLLSMAGFLSLRIVMSLFLSDRNMVELVSKQKEPYWEDVESKETSKSISSPRELITDVFRSVSKKGGKISAFSYRAKTFSEIEESGQCSFSIYGCNSEDVAAAHYSRVSFKNNEPYFELILPFRASFPAKHGQVGDDVLDGKGSLNGEENAFEASKENLRDTGLPQLRKKLLSLGAIIESERDGEESAELDFISPDNLLYSCLKTCGEKSEDFGWSEESLTILQEGAGNKVRLSFKKNASARDFSLLCLCATFSYLMTPVLSVQSKPSGLSALSLSLSDDREVENDKIGEIRKKDGSVLVCFRGRNGKIAYAKKEVVNER